MEIELAEAEAENNHDRIAHALGALDTYHAFNKRHQAEQLLAGLGFAQGIFRTQWRLFQGGGVFD